MGGDTLKKDTSKTKGYKDMLNIGDSSSFRVGRPMRPNELGRTKRAVWTIKTKPYSGAHFAVYPEELIETPIKAGCPESGIVLDPFIGSGTTALVALKLNRRFVGIDANQKYVDLAYDRIKPLLEQKKII